MLASDPDIAIRRLQVATEAGDLEAKFQLAVVLTDRDPPVAIDLLKDLDASNFDGAAYYLGNLYWDSDLEAAERWLRRAVLRQDVASGVAALRLGILLSYDRPEDPTEAVGLLERALNGGEKGAAFWLAVAVEKTDRQKALALYGAAAQEGDTDSFYRIGCLLQDGGDKEGAHRMFQTGAGLGDTLAMIKLFHLNKWRHPITAVRWLYRYVRQGGPQRVFRIESRRQRLRHS